MDEIERLVVRRIAVKMKQRQGERHAAKLSPYRVRVDTASARGATTGQKERPRSMSGAFLNNT